MLFNDTKLGWQNEDKMKFYKFRKKKLTKKNILCCYSILQKRKRNFHC